MDERDPSLRPADPFNGWRRTRRQRSGFSGLVMGVVIITLGVLLLLDNLNIFPMRDVWDYWPVILIVVGLLRATGAASISAAVWGIGIAVAGGLILLRNLHLFYFNFDLLWPLVIIAFGLSFLLRALERQNILPGASSCAGAGPFAGLRTPSGTAWTIFGSVERRFDSQDFRTADAAAMFGGVKLDLRQARIQADQAVIDVNCIFGGVDIFVPNNWLVSVEGTGIFGGFEDKTIPPRLAEGEKPQRLLVTGVAVFGGVSVK